MRHLWRLVLAVTLVWASGPDRTVNAQSAQDCFLGEVRWVAFNFAPLGWALAQGQLLAISQNTALFSLLLFNYGGDGQSTFALPDLRGRVPVGMGQGPGLSSYTLGQTGGHETVTLTAGQLPPPTPPVLASRAGANSPDPGNRVWARTSTIGQAYAAAPDGPRSGSAIGQAGGGQPFGTLPPLLTLTPIICVQGIFPSQ